MSNNYFNSTGTIGFTCDVCGRELQSCTWMNGMRFCAKCYQETFGTNTKEIIYVYGGNLKEHTKVIEEKDKTIADLEAKLARTQNELSAKVEYIHELVEVKDDYKQQLAEKEEEIKQLNNRILFSQLQAPEEQKLKIIGSSCCQYNPKRDKISFALEQLEKVKELVEEKSMTQSPFGTQKIYASDVSAIVDSQIEELKKENVNDKEKP